MPSRALTTWQRTRRGRIEHLKALNDALRLPGPGRRWNTEQLNRSLVIAVTSEFQGFARDLHDVAVEVFVAEAARGNAALAAVIRGHLTDRQLSRGNAAPAVLDADFRGLGLALWPSLEAIDTSAPDWRYDLDRLNTARNAIAHADEAKLTALRAEGCTTRLLQVNRWLRTLDVLAPAMDEVTSAHLASLFGIARPW